MAITQHIRDLCDRTVGDAVAEDYRRADVFEKYGIDFCCGGGKTVREACAAKGIACDEIMPALAAAEEAPVYSRYMVDVRPWPLDFLATYIEKVHHQYVRDNAGPLREITRTVARVHGEEHPQAIDIADLAEEIAAELEEHMADEEAVVFPFIERLCAARKTGVPVATVAFDILKEPLRTMKQEHDRAGEIMHKIRALSNNYTLPDDACNTYRIAYARLEAFEADLHRHVHLENNVLFPATIGLEEEVRAILAA